MDNRLECPICKKTFTQKSSLVRHSKRCTPGPAPSLRQKSCRQCTSSKTKCDLLRPKCSRCVQRDTPCDYIVPLTRGVRQQSPIEDHQGRTGGEQEDVGSELLPMADVAPMSFPEVSPNTNADIALNLNAPFSDFGFTSHSLGISSPAFDFNTDRTPLAYFSWDFANSADPLSNPFSTSAEQFSNMAAITNTQNSPDNDLSSSDWLLWATGPPKATPPLVRHSMETLLRVMKTWPRTLAKGFQTPPMFHFTHTRSGSILWPMVNCIGIAKMWANQNDEATEIVRQTAIQEMRSLFEQYRSMDERHLLATLQALVMYILILMFPGKGQLSVSLVDPAVFLCLQRVVSYVAKTGLLLTEERDCVRPSWESWVHVTAKRRAVFTLYLLHWSYSVYHNLESFACSQLGFMPAPAPKFLWQAETKEKWEDLYSRWLSQWGEYPYMMREFAAIQAGTALEQRTERWLEDADELGVLFFSIVNATERGDPVHDYGAGIPVLTS